MPRDEQRYMNFTTNESLLGYIIRNRTFQRKERFISSDFCNTFIYIFPFYFIISLVLLRNSADVPDEWWQSTEIAYQSAFTSKCSNNGGIIDNNGKVINITDGQGEDECKTQQQLLYGSPSWEWHPAHRIRSYAYPFMLYWVPFKLLRSAEDSITSDSYHNKDYDKGRPDTFDRGNDQDINIRHVINMLWSSLANITVRVVHMIHSLYVLMWDFISDTDTAKTVTPSVLVLILIRQCFYIIPKVTAAIVATLLHYKVCSLSYLLAIEWKCNNGNIRQSRVQYVAKRADKGNGDGDKRGNMNNRISDSGGLHSSKSKDTSGIIDASCKSSTGYLLKALKPRQVVRISKDSFEQCTVFATTVSQVASFLLLTNFMFLYTSTRQLSNVPEALLMMCVWEKYAIWQLNMEAYCSCLHKDKNTDEIKSALVGPSGVSLSSDACNVISSNTYKYFAKVLFYGGVGCSLRITMAVPFIATWLLFIISSSIMIIRITNKEDHLLSKQKKVEGKKKNSKGGTNDSVHADLETSSDRCLLSGKHGKCNKLAIHVCILLLITAVMGVVFLVCLSILDTYFYNLYSSSSTTTSTYKDNSSPGGYFSLGNLLSLFSHWWKGIVFTPYNFLKFNFISNSSALFGIHSVHWYFTIGLPACCGLHLLIPIMYYFVAKKDDGDGQRPYNGKSGEYDVESVSISKSKVVNNNKNKEESPSVDLSCFSLIPMLLITSTFTLFVFSSLGHKEMRFIFPVTTPSFLAVCAVLIVDLDNRGQRGKRSNAHNINIPCNHVSATKETIKPKLKSFTSSSFLVLVSVLHILVFIVISVGFKGGPLRVAHYFRGSGVPYTHDGYIYKSDINRRGDDGGTQNSSQGNMGYKSSGAFDTDLRTVCQQYSSQEVHQVKGVSSHDIGETRGKQFSLHILAGCYTLPGQSFFHRVFGGGVRSVSCSNMDMVESVEISDSTKLESDGIGIQKGDSFVSGGNNKIIEIKKKKTQRAVTEHELFLQDPLTFVKYAYLGIIPSTKAASGTVSSAPSSLTDAADGIASDIPDNEGMSSDSIMVLPQYLQKWIKSFQSTAHQISDLSEEEEKLDNNNKVSSKIIPSDSSPDPITSSAYERFSKCRNQKKYDNKSYTRKTDKEKEYMEDVPKESDIYDKSTECDLTPHTGSISGILNAKYYDGEADDYNRYSHKGGISEPFPDFLVIFSSTANLMKSTFLKKFSYIKMTSFFHTFAVVDDGTDYTIDVWVRIPSVCRM